MHHSQSFQRLQLTEIRPQTLNYCINGHAIDHPERSTNPDRYMDTLLSCYDDRYQICFYRSELGAADVEIIDYH